MRTYGQHCALARALDRVGDRWSLLIVRELLVGPRRWADLRAGLPGAATNLLSVRLRDLERHGLVRRRQLPAPAAVTVYELTEAGEALAEPVEALVRWGGRYMGERADEDAFAPHWLVVALRALTRPAAPWRLRVDGVEIDVAPEGVRLADEPAPPGRPVLHCEPDTALGLAAGRLGLAEALDGGRARLAAGSRRELAAAMAGDGDGGREL